MPCKIDHANQAEVANEDTKDNLCTDAMVQSETINKSNVQIFHT